MISNKHLYIDLEGTIIDLWDSNVEPVRDDGIYKIIHGTKWQSISIFSFAIDNGIDVDIFDVRWRPQLEQLYGVPFDNVITTRMVCKEVINGDDGTAQHYVKCRVGKESAFIKYINNTARANTEHVLIDDLVTTAYMHNLEHNTITKLLNVYDIQDNSERIQRALTFGTAV